MTIKEARRLDAEREAAWDAAAAHGRRCSDCGHWAGGDNPEPDFGWPGGHCERGHRLYSAYHAVDDAVRDLPEREGTSMSAVKARTEHTPGPWWVDRIGRVMDRHGVVAGGDGMTTGILTKPSYPASLALRTVFESSEAETKCDGLLHWLVIRRERTVRYQGRCADWGGGCVNARRVAA